MCSSLRGRERQRTRPYTLLTSALLSVVPSPQASDAQREAAAASLAEAKSAISTAQEREAALILGAKKLDAELQKERKQLEEAKVELARAKNEAAATAAAAEAQAAALRRELGQAREEAAAAAEEADGELANLRTQLAMGQRQMLTERKRVAELEVRFLGRPLLCTPFVFFSVSDLRYDHANNRSARSPGF